VAGSDIVFHLAAQVAIPYSFLNPRDCVMTNVIGSLNVAQACLGAEVERLVHTSSSEVYGSAQQTPIREDHPLAPQSPYAASKLAADKLMESYHLSFGLPVAIVRPFNTYGPHQSARAIVPTIVVQALEGGALRLGALDPRRDLTYVEDTCRGLLAAAQAPAALGRTVQLGTGVDVSIGELVDRVGRLLGRELVVEIDPQRMRPVRSEVTRLVSGPELARELLGWTPAVGLDEGLQRTIDWLAGHRHRYRAAEYMT
jgi:dTDP-glucose 4,6-dehydratase